MTSHKRSTTLSRVAKTSLQKPILRSSFQICSMGFISGVYGGMKKSSILSGTQRDPALCHAAPSQHKRIMSSGYFFDSSCKNMFIQTVLQFGIIRKLESPVILGSVMTDDTSSPDNHTTPDAFFQNLKVGSSAVLPPNTSIGNVSPKEIGYIKGLGDNVQFQFN